MSRNKNVPARAGQQRAVARSSKAELRDILESPETRAAIERVIPKYLTVDRMIGLAILAATQQPKLLECRPASVVQAVMQAAQLGLEINGSLQHAHLVPYNTKAGMLCQMIPGYRGLIFLAVESGAITKGVARLVYEGDEFTWIQGTEEKLIHVPNLGGDRTDEKIIGAYAVVTLPNGLTQFDVMNRQEIERVRSSSKAAKNGPWVDWFGEMAKKTVVKRLLKQIAMSSRSQRLANAIELDNRFESGEVGGIMPDIDTAESLNSAAADRTQQRAEELKERMRSARGREVGRVEEAEEIPPEREPEDEEHGLELAHTGPEFADDYDDEPPF